MLKIGKFRGSPPDLTTEDRINDNALFFITATDLWTMNNTFDNFWYYRIFRGYLSGIEDYYSSFTNIHFYIDDICEVDTCTIHWIGTRFENITFDESGGPAALCLDEINSSDDERY